MAFMVAIEKLLFQPIDVPNNGRVSTLCFDSLIQGADRLWRQPTQEVYIVKRM